MNIHEFQGKSLLKAYNVAIQEGFVAETPGQAIIAAQQLEEKFNSRFFVIKAQINPDVIGPDAPRQKAQTEVPAPGRKVPPPPVGLRLSDLASVVAAAPQAALQTED
jgi:hypothetical protein